MKKILVGLLLVSAFSSSVMAMNYDDASKTGKPVVVMFHMHGCGACSKLSPLFDKVSSKFSNKFSFAKEDINHSKIVSRFNFDTVPQVYIINPKTDAAKQMNQNCVFDKACFEKELNEYK